ncbi:MAG: hypothetical protein DWQ36_15490 [Acidobacteria bacterium]|nr:MAG: hypothetical protein DWQ36_15490 [Acidobacteriota bacterium]
MLAIALLVLAYGLLSRRLASSPITPPLFFAAGGLVLGAGGLGLIGMEGNEQVVHLFAELTLILVLFSDAAMIDAGELRRDFAIPLRMLAIGLPLLVGLGAVAGLWLLPELGWYGAGLLAAVLAPTDAALGQAVVTRPSVPLRMRTTLSTESGLNDGLALPLVLVFAACSAARGEDELLPWVGFAGRQLVVAALVGVAVGLLGARLLDAAIERRLITGSFVRLSGLALAVLAYGASEALGGNGFIAAFVGGFAFGNTSSCDQEPMREFSEAEGELLTLITFCLFGALFVVPAAHLWTPAVFLYALLSLTVIRILPIALSLIGTGLRLPSLLFLGWFGPRGLASILFALLVVDREGVPGSEQVFAVVVLVVAASIVLHGASASPLADAYGRWSRGMHSDAAEHVARTGSPPEDQQDADRVDG